MIKIFFIIMAAVCCMNVYGSDQVQDNFDEPYTKTTGINIEAFHDISYFCDPAENNSNLNGMNPQATQPAVQSGNTVEQGLGPAD